METYIKEFPNEKIIINLCLIFLLSLFISCSDIASIKTESSSYSQSTQNITEDLLTRASTALVDLSPTIAEVILNSDNILTELKTKSVLMKDGDYDVLFNDIKDLPVEKQNDKIRNANTNTFLTEINNKFAKTSRSANRCTAEDLINSIPFLNFRQKAFGKNGAVFELDGINPPDFPVIVLGINERSNRNYYREAQPSVNRAIYDGSITHDESIYRIDYYAKKGTWDPWPRGYPEIYLVYAFEGYGECLTQYYDEIDKPGTYTYNNKVNFSFHNYPANKNWKIMMYDEDIDGTLNTSVELRYEKDGIMISTTIPLKIGNCDDKMGEVNLDFFHGQNFPAALGSVATLYLGYKERR